MADESLQPHLDPEMVQEILHTLEQAINDHHTWLIAWHRSIICRVPMDDKQLQDDAHYQCRFGQWYYRQVHPELIHAQVFIRIGLIHQLMHSTARFLAMRVYADANGVTAIEYDTFMEHRDEFREQVRQLEQQLQNTIWHTDPLTKVFNRKNLFPNLQREHRRVVEEGIPCVICMTDLDRFKSINDQYGHPTGDQVLVETAGYFLAHLRPSDRIFRYGGEEFLLCLTNTREPMAYQILERLRLGLSGKNIILGDGTELQVTASFGLTSLEAGFSVEETVLRADQAMYAAKQAGRNQVRIWDPALAGNRS